MYKCTCPQIDCNESYIGEIERCFEEHVIDHNKRDKKSIFTKIAVKTVIPTFGSIIFK